MGPVRPSEMAQAVAGTAGTIVLASTFVPPADVPAPVARPDFGDRPVAVAQVAAVAAPTATLTSVAMTAPAPTPAADDRPRLVVGANGALSFAPDLASGAALVAYKAPAEEQADETRPPDPIAPQDGQRWRAAWSYVRTACFPDELKRAMNAIADHFHGEVLVASGFRDHGRRHSLHRSCRAADIRVAGVAPTRLAAFARTVPGVNGVGTYRHSTVTHIDVRASKYAWRY
jgi:hypothetical protein